jgi:glycosyltransferase involved in cell wall biosynthesis
MISIVIPNFNKADFIEQTLDSVIRQTRADWEVLVVDDGSTDDSVARAKAIADGDPRFRFFDTSSNARGANAARNIGWRNARHDYVLFLDSDDLITENCIHNRLSDAARHPEGLLIFPIGTFIEQIGDRSGEWRPRAADDHLTAFLRHRLPWSISSTLWRKPYLERLAGFSESLPRLQDVDLHTRALLADIPYTVIEDAEPDFYYRVSDSRAVYDPTEMCRRYVSACETFSASMVCLLAESGASARNRKRYFRALRGTTFAILSRLAAERHLGLISPDRHREFEKELTESACLDRIFGSKKRCLRIYCRLLDWGAWRIRGFTKITRTLWT